MFGWRALVAIVTTTSIIAACSSFGADVSGNVEDAGTEAGPIDGAPAIDAAPFDAGSDVIALADAAPFPCPEGPKVLLCDTFDDGTLNAGWERKTTDMETVAKLDQGKAHSRSTSVQVRMPANLGVQKQAFLRRTLPVLRVMTLRAWLYFDAWTGTAPMSLLRLTFDIDGSLASASVQLANGGLKLQVDDDKGNPIEAEGERLIVPTGRWFELTLFVDLEAQTAHVLLDGNSTSLTIPHYDFGGVDQVASVTMQIGLETANAEPATTAWIDDVQLLDEKK